MFQPQPIIPQPPQVVSLIESQYDYYRPSALPAQPTRYQNTVPISPPSNNTVTIIVVVGLLGFFTISLLAFLAYMKR